MSFPPRIVKRKIALLESELRMLQTYKTDASLLLDEYSKEYSSDMAVIESKLQPSKPQHTNTDETQNSSEVIDTMNIDPNDKEQEWKKTEDGWEKVNSKKHENQLEKPAAPEWAKKLYRKIALISHPDRASEDFNKDRLRKIFLDSNDAMSDGEFTKLLGLALELGIPTENTDASTIPLLEKRVSDVKLEITKIEKSLEKEIHPLPQYLIKEIMQNIPLLPF